MLYCFDPNTTHDITAMNTVALYNVTDGINNERIENISKISKTLPSDMFFIIKTKNILRYVKYTFHWYNKLSFFMFFHKLEHYKGI